MFANPAIDSSCWHRISPVNFYSQAKTLFIWCFLGSCYTLYTMCERVRGMTRNLEVWQCCYFQTVNWGKSHTAMLLWAKKITEHSAINLNICINFRTHLFITCIWICAKRLWYDFIMYSKIVYMSQFTNFIVLKCTNKRKSD